jgi:uncharacterized protein YlxP (DUF503 family)
MNIGVCRLQFRLSESHSLKDKRSVVRSMLAQVRNRFPVAAAEIEDQDTWQIITIGLASLSNDSRHAGEVVDAAAGFIISSFPQLELLEKEHEIIPAF